MQHYIDGTTLEVFGFKKYSHLIPCDMPKENEEWVDGKWVLNAVKVSESARVQAKRDRDEALQANTYTLPDGSVYQVRPQDLANFQITIDAGVSEKWVLADNTVRLTTIAELGEILIAGITQGKAIWETYKTTIEAL